MASPVMSPWQIALANLVNMSPPVQMKTCSRCDQDKPIAEFYVMGGRMRCCKACHREKVYARRRGA